MTSATLLDAAESYLLARPSCAQYARQIRNRIAAFAAWLNERPPTARLVNEYLAELEKLREPETVRGYRNAIVAVLRFAGWQADGPVRRITLKRKDVDCFLLDEIRKLVSGGEKMDGVLSNGVPQALFWPLAVDAGYSTALRWGDLLRVRTDTIAPNGECLVEQHKTGAAVLVRFTPEALTMIRIHGQAFAVPWEYSYNHFRTEFRMLCIASGVRRGTWKMLRASAGSHADVDPKNPGLGHRLLGNTRPVFDRHYNAFHRVHPHAVQPPLLRLPWWRRWLSWGA